MASSDDEPDQGKAIRHAPQALDEKMSPVVFDNEWLRVRRAGTPFLTNEIIVPPRLGLCPVIISASSGGYMYAERKGIDSIAFILVDSDPNESTPYGLIKEYKDPIGKFLVTAFGGSIDAKKYHDDLRKLVRDEVLEEAGFKVGFNDISYHGQVFCSTQQNQFVHLFSVNVDRTRAGKPTTKESVEMLSKVVWLDSQGVALTRDWKAPTIMFKMLAENGYLKKK